MVTGILEVIPAVPSPYDRYVLSYSIRKNERGYVAAPRHPGRTR